MCRLIMANYEPDLAAPLLDPSNVMRRHTYAYTGGRVTPYLLYLDLGHSAASTSAASPTTRCSSTTASASAASTAAASTTASFGPPVGARQGVRPAPGPPRPAEAFLEAHGWRFLSRNEHTEKFVNNFRSRISKVMKLEAPDGNIYNIQILIKQHGIWMDARGTL
ncbi:hypothetical protein ZWY2020_016424 [Hordeum vulgare]|nr:hypothetical protein ZWY2020_016424 [Hordeum vulgare]